MVLLIIGATVTAVASRALLIHGLPVIEVNDPARPVGTAGGSSNSRSWLGTIALPLGIVPSAIGIKMLADRIGAEWAVLLLASALTLLGAVTYVKLSARPRPGGGTSERAGHARGLTLVMRLMGCLLVALITARFGIQIGVIVTLLAVWLLPTLMTRHSQNRRASAL